MMVRLPFGLAKRRRAGIAGAGAEPGALAFGRGIEQADLQGAGYWPVTTSVAARTVPPVRPSPRTVTP